MKKGDYLAAKDEKKKSTYEAVIVLIVFIIVFMGIIVRFARHSGANEGFFSHLPNGADAYRVSKSFIRPTIQPSHDGDFPLNEFQCSKESDSVFTVRSYFIMKDSDNQEVKRNFEITLKYNGGDKLKSGNWTMVNLTELR